jgi:hypothetical protein
MLANRSNSLEQPVLTHYSSLITHYTLAHGALGPFDELAFVGIIVIFLVMVFFSWFRSRGANYEEQDLMPPTSPELSEERFKLE